MRNRSTVRVGKVPFTVATIDEAVKTVISSIGENPAISVRLSNAYCVALASKDLAYEKILNGLGLNYPDGTPVAWVMKLYDRRAKTVRGPTLFQQTIAQSEHEDVRHFFLGSTEDTLSLLENVLASRYPKAQLSGFLSPPFSDLDEEFFNICQAAVAATDANLVWVGLGTPKQDFVAASLAARLGIECVAVGAAFDFTAGTVKQAPTWIHGTGLEWAHRLGTEPKRLWKRYLIGNLQFIFSTARESAARSKTNPK